MKPGQQAPELLTVSTSDDHGATWSAPAVAAKGNGYVFNDKENLWADREERSPFFGRVYASWTQFRDLPGYAEPVMVAYSRDGGATWSLPKQVSVAQNIAFGGRQFSVLRSGPDGRVYLVWLDSDLKGYKQVVAVSNDGGASWTRPRTIAYLQKPMADPIPGANFRTGPYPTIATAAHGTVYVAWVDELGGTGKVVLARSGNGGTTWSVPQAVSGDHEGYAFFQGFDVAPNGRLDIAYQALARDHPETFGTGNARIDSWYRSSSDGGATWSGPLKISSQPSDPAASSQNNLARQFWGDYNTLVSTADAAWFIYTDTRAGVGCPAVDQHQQSILGTSVVRGDMADRVAAHRGQDPYSHEPGTKPAPPEHCDARSGNSDVYVSKVQPDAE